MSRSRSYASAAAEPHLHGLRCAVSLVAVALILASCTDENGLTPPDPQHPIEPGGQELVLTTIEDTADCDPRHGACSLYGAIEAAYRNPDGGPYTIVLAEDDTYRLTLPSLPGFGSDLVDESTVVMEGHGAAIERNLSDRALALRSGEHAAGGWRHKWDDGSQPVMRDVYFVDDVGALRNPDGETPDEEPLYNVAGEPVDLTWGEYRAAEGRSLVVVSPGDKPSTTFFVYLQGLVPEGVYSLFYTTFFPDSVNPRCPNALRDLPLTSIAPSWQRPDPSSFVANRDGRALYVGQVDGDLLDPERLSVQVIYHTDGQTYHPLPNRGAFETQGEDCRSSFGVDAMRQVVIVQNSTF